VCGSNTPTRFPRLDALRRDHKKRAMRVRTARHRGPPEDEDHLALLTFAQFDQGLQSCGRIERRPDLAGEPGAAQGSGAGRSAIRPRIFRAVSRDGTLCSLTVKNAMRSGNSLF